MAGGKETAHSLRVHSHKGDNAYTSDRVVVRFDKRIVERNAFVTKSEEDNNAIPLKVMLGTDRAFREQEDDKEVSCETSIELTQVIVIQLWTIVTRFE